MLKRILPIAYPSCLMKNALKKLSSLFLLGLVFGMSFFFAQLHGQANGEVKPGAIIVLSAKGLVQAVDPAGNAVSSVIKSGAVLAEGYTLKTGFGGEAAVLFSNGTTATLEPRTQISVVTFLQQSFNAGNQKLADLSEEPSTSQLAIKINSGAVICKTKKLNQDSSFTIITDAGTAKIMGTEFQMGLSPADQTKLDVATSTVSFSPAGGNPILVSQGKGLDVSSSGQVNQRPISPAISANISTKNAFAANIANQIPLATVNLAKSKAGDLASVNGVAASPRSFNGKNDDSEKDEDSETESDSSEQGTEAAESFLSQQGTDIRSVPGAQTSASYQKLIEDLANGTFRMEPVVKASDFELIMEDNGVLTLKFPYPNSEDDDENTYYESKTLTLSGKSLDDIYRHLQSHLGSTEYDNKLVATALYVFMDMAEDKMSWDNEENDALRAALDLSNIFLTDVTLSGSKVLELTSDLPSLSKDDISKAPVLNASDLVAEYQANPYLYEVGMIMAKYGAFGDKGRTTNEGDSVTDIAIEILKFAGGRGNNIPESISLGDESNSVLINAALLGSDRDDLIEGVTTNPAEGLSDSLSKKEQADALYKIYLDNIYGVVGADVTLGNDSASTELDVSNILTKAERLEKGVMVEDGSKKKIMAFAAANDLHLKGNLTFKNKNTAEDHILVLGAADHIETTELESIKYEGSNLGIGSYSPLTLNEVDIEVGGNLAIGSLSNIVISNNSTFSVGKYSDRDNVYLFAEKELKVDGLEFHARPHTLNERAHAGVAREIYMEAITIDLKNVHFPAESEVMLRSRDGKPNFYENGSPLTGKVNFYSNSNKYGTFPITSDTFTTEPNANPGKDRQFMGYDSVGGNFQTSTGEPGIKIRKFPN